MRADVLGGAIPHGVVRVSGAKNSATRLMSAAMLADAPVWLGNAPTQLLDVQLKARFITDLGGSVQIDRTTRSLEIDATELRAQELPTDRLNLPIRTTYLLAAGQLLRSGWARIGFPGGDAIGGRPEGGRGYDLHVMVWERLGCVVTELESCIEIRAPKGLVGGNIDFPISTVGGTETALLCASIAAGQTHITNAYITPEVEDLIGLLRRMGANITVAGSSHIVIEGQHGPLSGAHMDVIPDRIEALTWIVYGVLARGSITIEGVPFSAMEVPLLHLRKAGIDLYQNSTSIHVTPDCLLTGAVQPFEVSCGTYPGVISDMQALFVMLALAAEGTSRIYDYRYPDRIGWVRELATLVDGDHLAAEPGKITARGPASFRAGKARSTDVRGSVANVLAALCAQGLSQVTHVEHALRGYDDLEGKVRGLGGAITIVDDESLTR